jgi:hypothetical protein
MAGMLLVRWDLAALEVSTGCKFDVMSTVLRPPAGMSESKGLSDAR